MSDDVNNKILFGLCHTKTLALIQLLATIL